MRSIFGAAAASIALLLGLAQPSHAGLMLELTDGTTTDVVPGSTGIAAFFGAIGNFAANVTTGISKPMIGSATDPILALNSIDVTAMGGGALTIELTDTDFIGAGGVVQAVNSVDGLLTAGNFSLSTYLDCGNNPFGQTTKLTSQTSLTGSASSFVNGCQGNYSLTQVAVLTMPGGAVFGGTSVLTVPEPSTVAIFGVGLLGLGLALRRKAKAA